MKTDHDTDRLSAYLDGELAPRQQREVEAHVLECAACAAVLEDLRHVVDEARSLEAGQPARDLWPAIVGRIEAERDVVLPLAGTEAHRRRFSFTLPQLAAASLALILVSGGSVWMLGRAGDEPALARAPSSDVRAVPAALSADDTMAAQIENMERMLLSGATELDPMTIAVLRRNLLIIDQALAEAGAALRSDPANPYLSRHYQNTMQKKLELLRQAGSIGRGNT